MTAVASSPHTDSPAHRPQPVGKRLRYPAIHAELLPEEVIATRRLGALKGRLALLLALLLAVIAAGDVLSVWQTGDARSELGAAKAQNTVLNHRIAAFGPIVTTQNQLSAIQAALAQLMVGDVQWTDMIKTLNQAAPAGVAIASVSATMSGGAAAVTNPGVGGLGVLNQTGDQSVGTVTVAGTAPDQRAVASFVDTLATVPGLAAPFPASVTGTGSGGPVQFSLNVLITTQALGGRFTGRPAGGH